MSFHNLWVQHKHIDTLSTSMRVIRIREDFWLLIWGCLRFHIHLNRSIRSRLNTFLLNRLNAVQSQLLGNIRIFHDFACTALIWWTPCLPRSSFLFALVGSHADGVAISHERNLLESSFKFLNLNSFLDRFELNGGISEWDLSLRWIVTFHV